MTKLEKAQLLDKLLLKFEGNKSYSWYAVHQPAFYKDLDDDYYVVENHLNFLIGDGVLHETFEDLNNSNNHNFIISLTNKGFAVMTDIPNLGYVEKEKERTRIDDREGKTLFYAKYSFWAAVISVLVALIGLRNCNTSKNYNLPSRQASSTL